MSQTDIIGPAFLRLDEPGFDGLGLDRLGFDRLNHRRPATGEKR